MRSSHIRRRLFEAVSQDSPSLGMRYEFIGFDLRALSALGQLGSQVVAADVGQDNLVLSLVGNRPYRGAFSLIPTAPTVCEAWLGVSSHERAVVLWPRGVARSGIYARDKHLVLHDLSEMLLIHPDRGVERLRLVEQRL